MKYKVLTALLAATVLSGCSTVYQGQWKAAPHEALPDIPERPTAAWVQTHLPAFHEVAMDYPTAKNIARYQKVKGFAQERQLTDMRLARIDRQLTMAYDNFGRGGAAVRQPGYVHVINEEFNLLRDAMGNMSRETLATELASMIDGINEDKALEIIGALGFMEVPGEPQDKGFDWISPGASHGYSLYELSRWGRYCDAGIGMDERDWRFVTNELPNVPPVFDNCQPPTHDYHDYLAAWERFCESDGPSRRDLSIVRDSVRPQSTVNPCKAL